MEQEWSLGPGADRLRAALRGRTWLVMGVPGALTALTLFSCIGVCTGYPCVPVGVRYGLWLDTCPASDLRLQGEVSANLIRGEWGSVHVDTWARWIDDEGPYASVLTERMNRGVGVDLALIRADGTVAPGIEVREVRWGRSGLDAEVKLPAVPDGDYRLRATLDAGFETVVVDAEVPLYAPALVHVMSDRPLYKPGQEVLLRAAVLRRTDSAPIEERPGRWRVIAPDGTEMLVEKGATGPWGVASTTFPLDSEGVDGTWTAVYETGSDRDTITFDVRPFKLPRFTVELTPDARWYAVGDDITVEGTARYTSGAPVADAEVRLVVSQGSGRWPMPLGWEEPVVRRTDREGRFELALGEVPADLLERAEVRVQARVTDETGETAAGGTSVKLSQDALLVSAVTELGDGLVPGMNNRAYVRVTTPDGRPLRESDLTLRNPYDPAQPERAARTDADGVAALQLDPGAAITIVDPPPPVRVRPLTPSAPSLSRAERSPGQSLDLEERRALDRVHPAIAACGVRAVGDVGVAIGLQVDPNGTVVEALGSDSGIGRCVVDATRAVRFPAGDWRGYELTWTVPDTLQPHLELDEHTVYGADGGVGGVLASAALDARRCLPRGAGSDGADVFTAHWAVQEGSRAVRIAWEDEVGTGLSPAALGCVRQAFIGLNLDEPADASGIGFVTGSLSVPQPPGSARPRATTRTGYEFKVASAEGDTGRLVFPVGDIPHLRLRATPSLAAPGGELVIEMLRGPTFTDELPEELELFDGTLSIAKAKVDRDARTATFTIPADAEGFLYVQWSGARTVVYVRPDDALQVALSTDAPRYRPGETATLTVRTTAGESPTPAAVSLAGVDQTLAQLAPLLGDDDWGRITVRTTGEDVFGEFGPRALQLGQIQGENAAKAVVLKVGAMPMDAAGDTTVYARGARSPDEVEALTTSFYRGLEGLVAKARAWEAAAPAGEQMTAERCSGMWTEVLDAAEDADAPIVDAYGRTLTLRTLPPDLLAQTDPRQIVADSTRLPEDVTNWPLWVSGNAP